MKSVKRVAAQVVVLTLAGFSGPAPAVQPLVTDDTGTQSSGGNQLEFALNEVRASVNGGIERLRTLPIVYTRGLTETLERADVLGGQGRRSMFLPGSATPEFDRTPPEAAPAAAVILHSAPSGGFTKTKRARPVSRSSRKFCCRSVLAVKSPGWARAKLPEN